MNLSISKETKTLQTKQGLLLKKLRNLSDSNSNVYQDLEKQYLETVRKIQDDLGNEVPCIYVDYRLWCKFSSTYLSENNKPANPLMFTRRDVVNYMKKRNLL